MVGVSDAVALCIYLEYRVFRLCAPRYPVNMYHAWWLLCQRWLADFTPFRTQKDNPTIVSFSLSTRRTEQLHLHPLTYSTTSHYHSLSPLVPALVRHQSISASVRSLKLDSATRHIRSP